MSDTVSRKALIDKIDSEIWHANKAINVNSGYDRKFHKGALRAFQNMREIIESIHSTESEGEAHRHASQIVIDRLNDEIGIQSWLITEADAWCEYWRREAFRKYPTPEAYEAACRALEKQRAENERLRAALNVFGNRKNWIKRLDDYVWAHFERVDDDPAIFASKALEGSASETVEEDACRNCEGWERHTIRPNGETVCLNCGHVEKRSITSETAVQPDIDKIVEHCSDLNHYDTEEHNSPECVDELSIEDQAEVVEWVSGLIRNSAQLAIDMYLDEQGIVPGIKDGREKD